MTRRVLPLVALVCALASLTSVSRAQAQAPTLDGLLAQFAAVPGLEARFVEEKRVALLALPTRSEGRIHFAHPDRLIRHVERPDPSVALIAGSQLSMHSGGRTQQIPIDENPVLRGFVDSFRAVLAGDRAQLERFYRAALTPRPDDGEDAWTLVLHPRDENLGRFLRSITFRGHGVTIESMHLIEENGDETRTTFQDVNTQRTYTAAERRRIFRIP